MGFSLAAVRPSVSRRPGSQRVVLHRRLVVFYLSAQRVVLFCGFVFVNRHPEPRISSNDDGDDDGKARGPPAATGELFFILFAAGRGNFYFRTLMMDKAVVCWTILFYFLATQLQLVELIASIGT